MWIVFAKELLELSRDKKTLIFSLILPALLIPVLLFIVGGFTAYQAQRIESQQLRFALVGDNVDYLIAGGFSGEAGFERVTLPPGTSAKQGVEQDLVDFVLVLPDDESEPNEIVSTRVNLIYHDSGQLRRIPSRVAAILDGVALRRQQQHLNYLGLSEAEQDSFLHLFHIEKENLATQREQVGELIGTLVPYFLVLSVFLGAFYPAIDIAAGEKERRTLETLLLVPIPHRQLVLGKWLVVMTTSTMAGLLSLASFSIMVFGIGAAVSDVALTAFRFSPWDMLMMVLLLVPVSGIFAATLLAFSIYARNYKEAQTYTGQAVSFLTLVPLIGVLPGLELTWFWSLVPLSNTSLALKAIAKGTAEPGMLLMVWLSCTLLAGLLLRFCIKRFHREDVLYR